VLSKITARQADPARAVIENAPGVDRRERAGPVTGS
jgi:hypothetical protein